MSEDAPPPACDPEEVDVCDLDVSLVPADCPFPNEAAESCSKPGSRTGSLSDFSDFEDVEVARGVEVMSPHTFHRFGLTEPEDIKLTETREPATNPYASETDQIVERAKKFFADLQTNGEYARGLVNIKLGAGPMSKLPNEFLSELYSHLVTKINNRPRTMTVTSQTVKLEEFAYLIKLCFTTAVMKEEAVQNSLFRLYAKNDSSWRLKDLLRSLLEIAQESGSLDIEYSEIYALPGSNKLKSLVGGNIRYKTSNFKSYIRHEDQARALGFNVQTSLAITHKDDKDGTREVHLRWYDRVKTDQPRAVYIQMDHCAFGRSRLRFANFATTSSFDVDKDMIPTSESHPPVYDFVDILKQLAVGQSSL